MADVSFYSLCIECGSAKAFDQHPFCLSCVPALDPREVTPEAALRRRRAKARRIEEVQAQLRLLYEDPGDFIASMEQDDPRDVMEVEHDLRMLEAHLRGHFDWRAGVQVSYMEHAGFPVRQADVTGSYEEVGVPGRVWLRLRAFNGEPLPDRLAASCGILEQTVEEAGS